MRLGRTEEAAGKRLCAMRLDGEWRRETRTRASGRTEAGCALEGRPVPSAWLAGVRRTKAVSRGRCGFDRPAVSRIRPALRCREEVMVDVFSVSKRGMGIRETSTGLRALENKEN